MESDTKGITLELQPTPASNSMQTINEGSAEILCKQGHVFYNPVQQFNRDLSISVISTYNRLFRAGESKGETGEGERDAWKPGVKSENGLRILEALSATGLRSIRYAKEIPGVKEIIANDLSKSAVESIRENVIHNKVEDLIVPNQADATTLMYLSAPPEKRFDVIDLDPYGCPNKFLDGAVQSIKDGGLLLVTATDMAVLAGNTPEACFVKYGSVPLKTKACHEMALRILLRCIEGHANRYGKYIEPLLSISADFYVRVFVRVFYGPIVCKRSLCKQAMIYQCTGCETFTLQPLGTSKPVEKNPKLTKYGLPTGPTVNTHCMHCNHRHHLGGPIWSAPIHNQSFVNELLAAVQREPLTQLVTNRRIVGKLSVISEELPDVPLYYSLDKLCSVLRLEIIPVLKFRSALLHAGYEVSYSHACKNSIKTNAPPEVLWDILRCWSKRHPVKPERLVDGSATKAILEQVVEKEYNLDDIHPNANPKSRKEALARYPENPAAHWGPGTRATLMIGEGKMEKSHKNQNKRQRTKDSERMSPDEKAVKLDDKN
ncbi:unnamed protein product [Hermetia illucens]|uniref:tRNA (guanine(26)-N(2))-dimethyltransferase n=1 Tax=Hermetia illucens TaxID=343691 RepID=A0A7R8UFZ4_HERIL|nr:probable tRNA (guanine(26)-N(2))-dimethyltransferase isoform X2 [Hermetia illucens]CAD7080147.1 unnamed protein product [Hermetia illucens]